MTTNTYTILTEKRTEVEKKLARLQKKATKYSIPFDVTFGEDYAIEINRKNDYGYIVTNKYEVVDLTITSDIIVKDGYAVVAKIEHTATGNIVNAFKDGMDMNWLTRMDAYCEHCNSNHNLKYTFIVEKDNEMVQVGRTCLKDYCGIDPQFVGMANQFMDDIDEYSPEGYDFRDAIPCVYDSTEILALAMEIVKEQGYVKSEERDSNKAMIIKALNDGKRASDEYWQKADEMAKAIAEMSENDAIDALLNNVQVRIKGFYCKPSDFGYFAYAPVAYENWIRKQEEKARRQNEKDAMAKVSDYVGTVGVRSEFNVKETTLLTTLHNDYGLTFLYRFIDENDNVLIWFASNGIDDEKNIKRIKATVKAHNERDGVKQTILTRVKVA